MNNKKFKIRNINEAKIKYILSTLENQIQNEKDTLEINRYDYEFVCDFYNMHLTPFKTYKSHKIKIKA